MCIESHFKLEKYKLGFKPDCKPYSNYRDCGTPWPWQLFSGTLTCMSLIFLFSNRIFLLWFCWQDKSIFFSFSVVGKCTTYYAWLVHLWFSGALIKGNTLHLIKNIIHTCRKYVLCRKGRKAFYGGVDVKCWQALLWHALPMLGSYSNALYPVDIYHTW